MRDEYTVAFVPCKWCGDKTMMVHTKECDSCYEVRLRLSSFLESAPAREFVLRELAQWYRIAAGASYALSTDNDVAEQLEQAVYLLEKTEQ